MNIDNRTDSSFINETGLLVDVAVFLNPLSDGSSMYILHLCLLFIYKYINYLV